MKDLENLTVAVVGATGAVGREMISTLGQRQIPVKNLRLLASKRSAGESVETPFGDTVVEELTHDSFEGVDIALFSAGGSVSTEFAPSAAAAGAIVIDNSSAFRMHDEYPLVVPEVNADVAREYISSRVNTGGIIANPNCSTIQMVVALKPIYDQVGIERLVISTYQSVSGAGKKGMDELWDQTHAIFAQQDEVEAKTFQHRIAFNCIPHIDVFLDNGYTKEEMKMVKETRKILGNQDIRITATAVRVPVFYCHSESVNIETRDYISAEEATELLRQSPGIIVVDDTSSNEYPLARECAGTDATFVGRIRQDESIENGLNMWIVADNLRKGAALNAVQIAEIAIESWSK